MQQTGHVFIDCHGSGKVLLCKIIPGEDPIRIVIWVNIAQGGASKKKSQLSKLFNIKMNYCGI